MRLSVLAGLLLCRERGKPSTVYFHVFVQMGALQTPAGIIPTIRWIVQKAGSRCSHRPTTLARGGDDLSCVLARDGWRGRSTFPYAPPPE
ncbi:MAG: hypothetical protein DRH30_04020 [Deltaproteobacteria bacterium]|nr:MAG: hypothetical protein DRH30_04020 [Deltaproteobacteria bacterium]